MLLEGHGAEIFLAELHPEGEHLLLADFDRHGECENLYHFRCLVYSQLS